jgi:hypothetical protein
MPSDHQIQDHGSAASSQSIYGLAMFEGAVERVPGMTHTGSHRLHAATNLACYSRKARSTHGEDYYSFSKNGMKGIYQDCGDTIWNPIWQSSTTHRAPR